MTDRVSRAYDNLGREVTYTYATDGSANLLSVSVHPDASTTYTTQYAYQAYTLPGTNTTAYRVTTITDPKNQTYLTTHYDSNDRVDLQTAIDGSTYQFAYTLDSNGKVTRTDVTDPRGYVRRVEFNAGGYLTKETRALGTSVEQVTTYTRDSSTNQIASITDPLGGQSTIGRDNNGNVTTVTTLAGTSGAATTTYTYGAYDEPTSVTDALSRTTTFSLDSSGNMTTITNPSSQTVTFTYNAAGQPLTITDSQSHQTTLSYQLGALASATDPLGRISRRFVDAVGQVRTQTNGAGQTVRSDYDRLGRVTQKLDLRATPRASPMTPTPTCRRLPTR